MLFFLFTLNQSDKELIDTLFLQQHEKMYNLSYSILGSPQDAEDAMGDAFLRIIGNIEKIKKLLCHERTPYCVVIVKNCCMNILHKRKQSVPTEQVEQLAEDDLAVEDSCFRVEDAVGLAALMTKLSPMDRQILRLRHVDEMGYREIGKLLSITETAARKREQRALQKLRELYEKEGEA